MRVERIELRSQSTVTRKNDAAPYSEGGSHHPNHACAVGAPSVSGGRPLSRMVIPLQSHPQRSFFYNFACMGRSFWTYSTDLMGPHRARLAYREHLPNMGGCIIFARHCNCCKLEGVSGHRQVQVTASCRTSAKLAMGPPTPLAPRVSPPSRPRAAPTPVHMKT